VVNSRGIEANPSKTKTITLVMLPKIEKWIQGSLDLSVPLKTDDDLLVNPQEIEEDISNRVG